MAELRKILLTMSADTKNLLPLLMLLAALLCGLGFSLAGNYGITFRSAQASLPPATGSTPPLAAATGQELPRPLANPPAIMKAVYVTSWSAGSQKYLAYLNRLFDATQINAAVIDIKDYSGVVAYDSAAEPVQRYHAWRAEIPDINGLITRLHQRGIYVIGRIVVFEDPTLAKARPDLAIYNTKETSDPTHPVLWENNGGLNWVDPSSPDVWQYNIAIAKDALAHGFDEINFDYVRFPTDGSAASMGFPHYDGTTEKHLVIQSFFAALRQAMPDARLSADLFGQTTVNKDDMGIGQIFEDALPYFDYICPMVYPSHYINGFIGYQNPADHPYEVVKYSLDSGSAKQKAYDTAPQSVSKGPEPTSKPSLLPDIAKIRPWLQDFNLGAHYTAPMVAEEIQATQDATQRNFSGFLLWNPSNIYTEDAIKK